MKGEMSDILSVLVNDKKDIIVKEDNDIYQISTLSNQLDENYNISLIDFVECENILRQKYNLDVNHEIIIFKIEHYILGNKIPIIEYILFNEDGKIKLNLEHCRNISVVYQIPVSLNEDELYKYNPNGEYYNDLCYSDKADRKVDITLYDRKKEYNDNNMSLCEKNCTYKSYNLTAKKVDCECKLKFKISFFEDIYIDQDKLLDRFINIKSITNILIIKCYKILFSKNGIIFNIGSYILLSFIFISTVQSFLFYFKGYNLLSDRIKRIVQINFQNLKTGVPLNDITNKLKINSNIIKEKVKNKNITKNKKFTTSLYYPPKKQKPKLKKSKNKKIELPKNTISNSKISYSSKTNIIVEKKKKDQKGKVSIITDNKIKDKKSKNNIMKNYKDINDYEINSLSYKEAVLYDKRTYYQYYLSLIRVKHIMVFTFYTKSDYNSRSVKINLFLFSFALYYTVNTLFFNDSTMHQIYEDQGNFNFIYQIPQIIYSSIISSIIKMILTNLSLTESRIAKIKKENNFKKAIAEMKNLLKCLATKFIIFFICSFLFLSLFWYYVSCFCAIYKKTQLYLIKDSFISF